MKRSATRAETIEKALSQPNRRSDGKSENTVTTRPQARTTVVRISAGPTVLVGPALILTTVVLACGLVVTVFSDLPSLRLFGWLSAFSMVSALVADLFILRPTAMFLINLSQRIRGTAGHAKPAE